MIKIKRKLHNKMFKYRQLKFYQYSIVSDLGDLECYYSKWFLILSFIPVLFVGTIAEGFPNTFKMLIMYFKEPYSCDSLTMSELKQLKRGMR